MKSFFVVFLVCMIGMGSLPLSMSEVTRNYECKKVYCMEQDKIYFERKNVYLPDIIAKCLDGAEKPRLEIKSGRLFCYDDQFPTQVPISIQDIESMPFAFIGNAMSMILNTITGAFKGFADIVATTTIASFEALTEKKIKEYECETTNCEIRSETFRKYHGSDMVPDGPKKCFESTDSYVLSEDGSMTLCIRDGKISKEFETFAPGQEGKWDDSSNYNLSPKYNHYFATLDMQTKHAMRQIGKVIERFFNPIG